MKSNNSLRHDYKQYKIHIIYIYTYTLEHACSMLGKVKHNIPKWWFNGDVPLYKVNNHLKQIHVYVYMIVYNFIIQPNYSQHNSIHIKTRHNHIYIHKYNYIHIDIKSQYLRIENTSRYKFSKNRKKKLDKI